MMMEEFGANRILQHKSCSDTKILSKANVTYLNIVNYFYCKCKCSSFGLLVLMLRAYFENLIELSLSEVISLVCHRNLCTHFQEM